jgi:predicted transposase/invertase (TIGR01784 family)
MSIETKLVRFDWAIKSLLRDKANFDVLEGFLSAVMCEEVEVIEILDSESNQPEMAKKFNRVDILVKDKKQRSIIVEIQNHRETGYLKRILWGTCKLLADSLALGKDYRYVSKVISINILYFNLGLDDDYIYHGTTEFHGIHTQKTLSFQELEPDTRKMEKRTSKEIFPEYYLINVERFEDVIASDLDEWIYLLKHSSLRDDFKAKNIDKAREKLTLLKMSSDERKHYENYIQDMIVEQNVIETARTDGKKEGLKEGLQKGENQAKLAIAHKMLESGMDIKTIATFTGLSVEVINNGEK